MRPCFFSRPVVISPLFTLLIHKFLLYYTFHESMPSYVVFKREKDIFYSLYLYGYPFVFKRKRIKVPMQIILTSLSAISFYI